MLTKRGFTFRPNVTPQDKGAIISTAILAALSLFEAFAFAAFSICIASKKPNRKTSILKTACSKFNVLLLTMFIMSFIWSTCACYGVSLFHNNLALAVPQSIETLASSTVEICFMHYSWAISFGIMKRNSSKRFFTTMSTLVLLSPFIFYGQAIAYIIAAITNLPVMITVNRIWTAVAGSAESVFCIYLMAMFSMFLMKQEKDLEDSLSTKDSKTSKTKLKRTSSVVGQESRNQRRRFKTIARYGIWASLFTFAAIISFVVGLLQKFAEWENVFHMLVYVWINFALIILFAMKVQLDVGKKRGNDDSDKIRSGEPQLSEEKKSSMSADPALTGVRTVVRNSFIGKSENV